MEVKSRRNEKKDPEQDAESSNSSEGSRKKFLKQSKMLLEKAQQTLSKQKRATVAPKRKASSRNRSSRSRDDSYEALKRATAKVKEQLKELQKGANVDRGLKENSSLRQNSFKQPPSSARSSTSGRVKK